MRHHGVTRKLLARRGTTLKDATICATDPKAFANPAEQTIFDALAARARSVRFGGDCYTPCMVAAGHADLVIESGLKPWDVQAFIPIVESAGGVITDWQGANATDAKQIIVASSAALHAEVLAAMRSEREARPN